MSDFTLMGWVSNTKTDYPTSFATIGALHSSADAANSPLIGAVGFVTSAGVTQGRPYCQPGWSTGRILTSVMNQGWVHVAITVTRISSSEVFCVHYVNGIPLFETSQAITSSNVETLIGGSYNINLANISTSNFRLQSPDKWTFVRFYPSVLTEDEISAVYLDELATLEPTQTKVLGILCGDSLTAFSPSWSFDTGMAASLRPGCHFMLEAWGGSHFLADTTNGYRSTERQALRRRVMKYGAAHYDKVVVVWAHGTNDIGGANRAMSESSPYGGWQEGAEEIDAMIADDVLSVPEANRSKIELAVCTVLSRADWLNGNPTREGIRQDYNDWTVANYLTRGFDYLIDQAAWVPTGFTSQDEAAIDAAANGGNSVFLADGLHWSDAGGAEAAADIFIPFFEARLAEV